MEKKKYLLNEDDLSKVMGGLNFAVEDLDITKKEGVPKVKSKFVGNSTAYEAIKEEAAVFTDRPKVIKETHSQLSQLIRDK